MTMYTLPVLIGRSRAEPQKDDGIAQTWILVDPKVYPGLPMPQGWQRVIQGTVMAVGSSFVEFSYVLFKYLTGWVTNWMVSSFSTFCLSTYQVEWQTGWSAVFLRFAVSTFRALLADPGGPLSDELGGRQSFVSFPNIINQKRRN